MLWSREKLLLPDIKPIISPQSIAVLMIVTHTHTQIFDEVFIGMFMIHLHTPFYMTAGSWAINTLEQ
jgi:hypothetical protein